uniref:Glutaredoxin domain-containing protein n=1 Tax=Arcella intermedia TaxID=1963864 RepID=A0A6B2LRK3_9EUKA
MLLVVLISLGEGSLHSSDIEQIVNAHPVVLFSKSYCPYCKKAKGVFDSIGVPYYALELDQLPNGPEYQNLLLEMTGQRTVPSVWIHGKHIGGSDKVVSLHAEGLLKDLVHQTKEAEL